jgi:hypothetical protein
MIADRLFALKGRWIIAPANGRGLGIPPETQPEGLLQMVASRCINLRRPYRARSRGGGQTRGVAPGYFASAFQALGIARIHRPWRLSCGNACGFETLGMIADRLFALKGRWIIAPANGRGLDIPPLKRSLKGCRKWWPPDVSICAALTGLGRGGTAKPGALPRAILRRPFRPGIARIHRPWAILHRPFRP